MDQERFSEILNTFKQYTEQRDELEMYANIVFRRIFE